MLLNGEQSSPMIFGGKNLSAILASISSVNGSMLTASITDFQNLQALLSGALGAYKEGDCGHYFFIQ